MFNRSTKLDTAFFLILLCSALAQAQEKPLQWKFPAEGVSSSVDKASGIRFYNLDQGVSAALQEHNGVSGAVIILPGERLSPKERVEYVLQGTDPDRMLTAMAVAIALPIPSDTSQFFVAKEKSRDRLVYRWRTANAIEVCASNIPFEPFSKKHDVMFLGPCTGTDKRFVVLSVENQGSTLEGYERYRPRTFTEIIKEHSDPEILRKNDGSMILTGDTFPSKLRVTYTGKTRPISTSRKQHLEILVTSFNVDSKLIARYGTEMLFLEGEDEHWLPVLAELISFFEKEVKKDEEITLYAEWVGAKKTGGKWEWLFIVQEFQK